MDFPEPTKRPEAEKTTPSSKSFEYAKRQPLNDRQKKLVKELYDLTMRPSPEALLEPNRRESIVSHLVNIGNELTDPKHKTMEEARRQLLLSKQQLSALSDDELIRAAKYELGKYIPVELESEAYAELELLADIQLAIRNDAQRLRLSGDTVANLYRALENPLRDVLRRAHKPPTAKSEPTQTAQLRPDSPLSLLPPAGTLVPPSTYEGVRDVPEGKEEQVSKPTPPRNEADNSPGPAWLMRIVNPFDVSDSDLDTMSPKERLRHIRTIPLLIILIGIPIGFASIGYCVYLLVQLIHLIG